MNKNAPNLRIAQRRTDILSRLESAAKGQMPTLVAVSKVQPDERIEKMLETGQTVFGENRVQEAQQRWGDRFQAARSDLRLHLIGPLQTNKAKEAAQLFDVIETLDREKLALHLSKASQSAGRCPDIFVQVNTGEEPQKAGVLPADLDDFLAALRKDYDLPVKGLMCIPPVSEAPSPHFIMLSQMARRNGLSQLSMGMSADFETAAALGATHVRVGSALFGNRDYA